MSGKRPLTVKSCIRYTRRSEAAIARRFCGTTFGVLPRLGCGRIFHLRFFMASSPDNGLIHLSSRYPVSETLERLETVLHAHQQIIFARVDHSGEANQAGLDMRPTK